MLSSPDSTYHPTVLQLCLERSGAPSGGRCTFKIQTIERTITSATVACSTMGLLATQNEMKAAYDYMIPTSSLLELESDIAGALSEDVPLWLQFAGDCGNLPLLPWERLLQPIVHAPILRMPYYDFKPFAAASSCLDIVLCASRWSSNSRSSPIEMQLNKLARSLLETIQMSNGERGVVIIHIFSDSLTYHHLQRLLADRCAPPDGSGVRLYNPDAAADIQVRKSAERNHELPALFLRNHTAVTSTTEPGGEHGTAYPFTPLVGDCTWLHWILNAFQDHSADAVHFLCRGSLSTNQGSMLLEGTPNNTQNNRRWSIGAQQLNAFSTRLGAWCVGLSTPDAGNSVSGLRLLIDQLARLRPGPVLLQESRTDSGEQTLANLYRFLCNEVPGVLPNTSELSIYCHPSRILKETQHTQEQVRDLHQYTLAKGRPLKIMQSTENTPGWIASTQRYLEQSTAQLLHTPDTPSVKKSTQQGIEQALSFLSTILTQHTITPGVDKDASSQEDLL